jgi:RimJ/RimL family protein N-acetyltransferase
MEPIPDPWPLRHLVLRTPHLELRPDDDAGLLEMVEQTYAGIHDAESMPFAVPWTDAPREELGRNSVQFYWSQRAELRPDKWTVNFLVRLDGDVIGVQGLVASDFGVTREVSSGSWLGRSFQGKGLGTEMRAAVLQFAFDHLGARTARSGAWHDNAASLGVSRKLGYLPDGTDTAVRRDRRDTQQRLLLTKERFAECRPQWTITVDGLTDECRRMLGA